MIGIFLGEQSSGKTLSMTFFLYQYYKKGYEIYTNYNLSFKHNKITPSIIKSYLDSQKQFNKAVFGIDEIYLMMDSRSFGSKMNKTLSYFLLQTSKRNVHLFGTAQYFSTVEKRFRQNCNFKVNCQRVLKGENSFYPVSSNLRDLSEEEKNMLYIKNMFVIKRLNGLIDDFDFKTFYLKAKPIFNLYDTKELLNIGD